ncbi:MAG: hypothetical protein WD000_00340 [Thermodesulfobacteriota bacterium]
MRKCPYCAENIKSKATVCKHCHRDQPIPAKNEVDYKTLGKVLGVLALVLLTFIYWYVTIPGVVLFYLWRSKKLQSKTKYTIGATTVVVFFVLGIANAYANRTPEIVVTQPESDASLQAETVMVKGDVSPSDADITINGSSVKANDKGEFTYEAKLTSEQNNIKILAKNGKKTKEHSLVVDRIFTEEEKAERERIAKERAERIAKEREEEKKRRAEEAEKAREELEKQQRKEKIEKQFSAWDGSHRELTKFIQESMNDPDSYDHVETKYLDKEDHLIVITTFRGKNAFGGTVANTVTAKVSLDGEVLEILGQS